ncbi:hypothetical protein D9757_005206 [Collybiopsis confluens]|uniref:Uncharacterized protein n=1 Tax=Collybiopsis confluens TaxID=2823264 RepID=A0A8H5HVV2_9AGAR|nr:hypothetical protein D9757_005206 [Collybiopsis confluens]
MSLQSLIQSFGLDATQNVSEEALQSLSDKLSELLGADVVRDAFSHRDRAEMASASVSGLEGSLVNEEGLPIIEITEPEFGGPESLSVSTSSPPAPSGVSNSTTSARTPAPNTSLALEESPLIPISQLPQSERDLRRRERDRILDMLEAEEALEQHREREREERVRIEALDRRKPDGTTERERLFALRETHKKMGKALLRSVVGNEEKEVGAEAAPLVDTSGSTEKQKQKKKSVSFAETDDDGAQEAKAVDQAPSSAGVIHDWGDVSQGRLRPTAKSSNAHVSIPALPREESERLMKWQVVERAPASSSNSSSRSSNSSNPNAGSTPFPLRTQLMPTTKIQIADIATADSDDESDAGGDSPPSSDEDDVYRQDSDTDHSDADLEEENADWDSVQHQREIAVEYYRKRAEVGKENYAALREHTHDRDENRSSQLLSQRAVSSTRTAHSSDPLADSNARSLDSSTIIPAANANNLEDSVRYGKLTEDRRLVQGEADDDESDSDDEAVARGIIELLQKGQVYNIGSTDQGVEGGESTIVTIPLLLSLPLLLALKQVNPKILEHRRPLRQHRFHTRLLLNLSHRDNRKRPDSSLPKLKLNVRQRARSQSSTPVSTVSRSSPKPTLSAMESAVVERSTPTSNSPRSPALPPSLSSSLSASSPHDVTQTIVESPSFPSTISERRPDRPPTVMSAKVVESSSSSFRDPVGRERQKGDEAQGILKAYMCRSRTKTYENGGSHMQMHNYTSFSTTLDQGIVELQLLDDIQKDSAEVQMMGLLIEDSDSEFQPAPAQQPPKSSNTKPVPAAAVQTRENPEYQINKYLTPPKAINFSTKALSVLCSAALAWKKVTDFLDRYEHIHNSNIDLSPEYQRALTVAEDGAEQRICIDGKQRLTSIQRSTSKKYWFKAIQVPGSREKQVLPERLRTLFANKQIRVQQGEALKPSEKLGVNSTPRASFIRELIKTYAPQGTFGNIPWSTTRGVDFSVFAHIVHSIENWAPSSQNHSQNRVGTYTSVIFKHVEDWLAGSIKVDQTLKDQVCDTFDILSKIAASPKYSDCLHAFKKVAPIEMIFISLLIYVHGVFPPPGARVSRRELYRYISKMRTSIRDEFPGAVRLNDKVGRTLAEFISQIPPKLLPPAPPSPPKLKRKREDVDAGKVPTFNTTHSLSRQNQFPTPESPSVSFNAWQRDILLPSSRKKVNFAGLPSR